MFAWDAKPERVDELASDIRQIAAAGVAQPENPHRRRSYRRVTPHIALSSPAECPEDPLDLPGRVGVIREGRLILIRSGEHRQHVGKRRKVFMFDGCVERLLHTMIARDEGRIDLSHRLSAYVGFELLKRPDAIAIARAQLSYSCGVREQAAHIRVSFAYPRQRHRAGGKSA